MTSTSRRTVIAIAAFLAAAPALAACGAGTDANTNLPYTPTEAQVLISGEQYGEKGIRISQAFLLGPDPGGRIPAGGAVPLYLAITNENAAPDTLVGITPDTQQATSATLSTPVQVAPHTLVTTGRPQPQVTVDGVKNPLLGGEVFRLTLKFQTAGDIIMDVPVLARSREFATLPPVPGAQPAPSPAASASPTELAPSGH
ncbi:copper chaperone PCu(A)C [Acrocarpospora catenulata]|uniref:copper chaperone PCu(A)C n=1 Tax=Acrocarpospora catenulata TaxID=2836182 RepID=UPI001BDB3BC2|nr:copper chaperone PCu(A)C [Acrocarpospora catenulata]